MDANREVMAGPFAELDHEAIVKKYNSEGWVLYYVSTCPIVMRIRQPIGWKLWMEINKVPIDIFPDNLPTNVRATPIWRNKNTGELCESHPFAI
jgi:hypothetical protein